MRVLALVLTAALVAGGCKWKSHSKEDDEPEVQVPDFPRDPSDDGIVTSIMPAPQGASATRAAREQAVVALLGGKLPSKTAELAATDPPVPFDRALRIVLTNPKYEAFSVEVDAKASGVDEAAATAFVATAKPTLEACARHGQSYVMRQNRHVVVTVRIGAGGVVQDARRTSMDVFDSSVLDCIDQKLRRFRVDGSPGSSARIELALRFAP